VVRAASKALFGRKDPFNPADVAALSTRRLPSFYAPDFIKEVDSTLVRVLTSGGRLFVRGKAYGVGVSTLLTDLARAFNYRAELAGYDERVLYVQLQEVKSSKQLMRVLLNAVACPMTNSDARTHPLDTLAERFLVAASRRCISTVIIDHVHNAHGDALSAVGSLMAVMDPSFHVPLHTDEYSELVARVGVVLASHKSPAQLFRHERSALHALVDGGELVVEPFADRASLAAALRQADIGLHDLDLAQNMDELMVEWILAVTGGRLSLITPLLQLVDVVSRAYGNARPNMAFLHAALPFQRSMRERILVWTEPKLQKQQDGSWTRPARKWVPAAPESEATPREVKGRAATLKEKQKHKDAAHTERRKLNKRRNVNLPGM
jgi:hypothetical protein